MPDQAVSHTLSAPIPIASGLPVELRAEVDLERLRFGYRVGGDRSTITQQLDASLLSDEATAVGAPNFTGASVSVACQDLAGTALPANFDFFDYRPRSFEAAAGRSE